LTIAYFSDRSEISRAKAETKSREEKLDKFRELTKEYVRARDIRDEVMHKVEDSHPATVRDANGMAYDLLQKQGLTWGKVDWLWQERCRLGKELGIPENELSNPQP
jgi:hypothetical protein